MSQNELALFEYEFIRKVDISYIKSTVENENYFYIINTGEVLDSNILNNFLDDVQENRPTNYRTNGIFEKYNVVKFSIDIPDLIAQSIHYENLYEYFNDSCHNNMSVCDVLEKISSKIKISRIIHICEDFHNRKLDLNPKSRTNQFDLLFDFGSGVKESNWYFLNDAISNTFGQSFTYLVMNYYSYGGGLDEPVEDYINVVYVMSRDDKNVIKTKEGEEIELNTDIFF